MGTRINGLRLTKVIDGDTINVEIDGHEFKLRLLCLDTEESDPFSSKPVTKAGEEVTKLTKQYFSCDKEGFPEDPVDVDIEFDRSDPKHVCLQRHFDINDRLLCYVHKGGENYNLMAIREGWSPYFVKYGRSRLYHEEFLAAEAMAQSEMKLIWDPSTNLPEATRDYKVLAPWWHSRDSVVVDYRKKGLQAGVLSVRPDYPDIVTAANNSTRITILCDLQGGIHDQGPGSLVRTGSKYKDELYPFDLWVPDRTSMTSQAIIRLIEKRYVGEGGRGYVYVSGEAFIYTYSSSGHRVPEIALTSLDQLSDIPPGS